MNAYEIVDQIFDKYDNTISDNELYDIAENEYDIVVAILKSKYKGKYIPSMDAHFCGSYSFENPFCTKEVKYLFLHSQYYNEKNYLNFGSLWEDNEKGLNKCCKEIMRLEYDDIYWKGNEKEKIDKIQEIKENLIEKNHHYFYLGEGRIWQIIPTIRKTKAD